MMSLLPREIEPLVAYVTDAGRPEQTATDGTSALGMTSDHMLTTPSARAYVQMGTADRFGEAGDVQVVLHGEVYHPATDPASWIASQVVERGVRAAVRDLVGTFTLLVADAGRDVLAVVTDRVNARRMLARPGAAGLWCATAFHPALANHDGRILDPVGVAWYLSNGVVYGGRTVYDGVRVLERARVHTWADGQLRSEPYWTFEITGEREGRSEHEVATELGERLMRGVDRCLFDDPDVFLSLSGGYDAAAVGGMLAALKAGSVQSFSYLVGEPGKDADEGVAQAMAAELGFTHRMVQGFEGDLIRHIRDNARWGRGLCNVSDELDAWRALAPEVESAGCPVLFAGDECLGWDDVRLRNGDDVLHAVRITDFNRIAWLRGVLPATLFDDLAEAQAAARRDLLERCPRYADLHDVKDYLYLDQRIPNLIMPWRQYVAGRLLPVRNPLLDPDVLELVATLPPRWRRGKVLFRRAITAMFPKLFRIPRARRGNYGIDLSAEFADQADAVRALIRDGASPLDNFVPPDAALAVLETIVQSAGGAPSLKQHAVDAVKRWLPPFVKRQVKRRTPPVVDPVSRGVFLRRWLVLREAVALSKEVQV